LKSFKNKNKNETGCQSLSFENVKNLEPEVLNQIKELPNTSTHHIGLACGR
jgi:hypothetical protein